MKREFDRYVVIKWSDAKQCLSTEEQKLLVALGRKFQQHRRDTSRPWECIVVEHDWPEYESVWKAIEQRVDGPQPLPQMNKDVLALADNISKAVLTDEIAEGCDISAGMFGPAFSQLVHKLAVAQQKAALFDQLRDLLGYVENGTDEVIRIYQDDATREWTIACRNTGYSVMGGVHDKWWETAPSLEQVIKVAYEKHGGD